MTNNATKAPKTIRPGVTVTLDGRGRYLVLARAAKVVTGWPEARRPGFRLSVRETRGGYVVGTLPAGWHLQDLTTGALLADVAPKRLQRVA